MSENSTTIDPADVAAASRNSRAGRRSIRAGLPKIGSVRRLNPLYSQMVVLTKFILPTAALVLVLVVIVWPYLQKEAIGTIGFSTGGALGEHGSPTMVNPRYTGVDKDDQPFAVTADIAHNVVVNSSHVELEMPKADITTEAGTWMVITAETGVYDRDAKSLDLAGSVNLFHDKGYELNTDELRVDIQARTAESILPVQGQGPIGDILSEGFRLNNVTRIIVFTGKSRLLLYPGVMGGG